MEDKQKICKLLLCALQATREYEDLLSLEYSRGGNDRECVTAVFSCGSRIPINVSLDSGSAMIRDIMRCLA